jgi:hypothetical protein
LPEKLDCIKLSKKDTPIGHILKINKKARAGETNNHAVLLLLNMTLLSPPSGIDSSII